MNRLARSFWSCSLAAALPLGCSSNAEETPFHSPAAMGGSGAATSAGTPPLAGGAPSAGTPPLAGGAPSGGTQPSTSGGDVGVGGVGSAAGAGANQGGSAGNPGDLLEPLALPPVGKPHRTPGRIETRTFRGPISLRDVVFNVYLPPGYDDQTTQRYPVAYRLHGKTDSRDTRNDLIISNFESALEEGLTCPFIVVFPEAMYNSFYADSKDGTKPVETQIIRELLPHVDDQFRTLRDPRARVLYGWSMGGHGAMEYMTKFPDLWGAAVAHDGGIRSWLQLDEHPDVKQDIFANDEAYFQAYSPFANLEKNATAVRQRVAVRLVAAERLVHNRTYRDLLLTNGIPVSYVEVACGHDEACVVNAEGKQSWRFMYEAVAAKLAR